MCQFFSFISDGDGNVYYFSAEQRRKLTDKEVTGLNKHEDFDSHSVIAEFYKDKFKDNPCDNCNKYEFNIENGFYKDQINVKDDSKTIQKWLDKFVDSREFSQICLDKISANKYGVNESSGVNRSYGVNESSGVNRSYGVNESSGVNRSYGVNRSDGVDGSDGVNRSYGVNGSYGVNESNGVNGSYGVNWSYGILNSYGVDHALFLANKKRSYTIFGKEVEENRFSEVFEKFANKLNGWKPTFNNIKALYIKHGNDWKLTPIKNAEEISKQEAWQDMPVEAIEYIKSLPEFDAEMFEEITCIK
jgi:hypothetical protein